MSRSTTLFLLITLSLFHAPSTLAHEASGTARIGPDMAVLAANEDEGIQLTELAIKTIGVRTVIVSSLKGVALPKSSLLQYRDQLAIYRVRASWFKRLDLVDDAAKNPTIDGLDLKSTDSIVTAGVPLLRASELEAMGSEEEEEEGEEHHEGHDHAGGKDEHGHEEKGDKHER